MRKVGLIVVVSLFAVGVMLPSTAFSAVKEITIWSWGAPEAIKEGLKENTWPLIEKEFGIKIKHEFFPGISEPEFVRKIVSSVRFGKGPDIIEANDNIFSQLGYQGFLTPIPSWLNESLQEKLLPSYRKIHYFWNKDGYKKPFMGILVRSAGGQLVWWNKTMYAEAGLPGPPKTWEQVYEYGKKLTVYNPDGSIKRSGFFLRTGGHIGGIGDKWQPYFLSAGGGSLLKLENGKPKANFNTEAGRKTCQFYLDALYKYKIDAIGIPGDVGGWEKGQTATVSARRAWVPQDVKRNTPDMYPKLGVGPIPVAEEGMKSMTTSHVYGFAVPTGVSSEKKEFIWKLCDRLNKLDMVKKRVNDIEVWLPYKEALKEPPFDIELWQNFVKYGENTIPRLEAPKFALVHNLLGEQLQLIFTKEKSIEEGLAAAVEKVNELYEDVTLKEM